MPILSPDEVVPAVPDVLVPDLFELSAAVLLLPVSVLLQPIRMAAHKIKKTRRDFLNIGFYSFQAQLNEPGSRNKGIEKRRYDTREAGNWQHHQRRWQCMSAGNADAL